MKGSIPTQHTALYNACLEDAKKTQLSGGVVRTLMNLLAACMREDTLTSWALATSIQLWVDRNSHGIVLDEIIRELESNRLDTTDKTERILKAINKN